MKAAVRALRDLGEDLAFAPERHVLAAGAGAGVSLGDLVIERSEIVDPRALGAAVVLDTTHARDGLLDVPRALREPPARSAKKRALAGDVLVSRLRPYLRQVALVHPAACVEADGRPLAVSTEFYVLAPRDPGGDLAWLVPFLLSDRTQEALAAAQEGGHHPRVPRASLLALRVPHDVLARAGDASAQVSSALRRVYEANAAYRVLLTGAAEAASPRRPARARRRTRDRSPR